MTQPEFIPPAKPIIGEEERKAVDAVLASGMVAQGPEVAAFEQEFGDQLVDGRTCVAVNSGTSGPPPRPARRRHRSRRRGHRPVVHLRRDRQLRRAHRRHAGVRRHRADLLLPRPARRRGRDHRRAPQAIMPVHLFGHPADMTALGEIAERHGVMLFEDAAQAHGATWDGASVGTFGTFAMFSLYPTKNMTSGEGGMVACADDEIVRQVKLLRNQGMERQYANEVVGLNNRMTDIHAAIGRVQLTKIGGWTDDPPGTTPRSSTRTSRASSCPPVADDGDARLPPVHDPRRRGPRRGRPPPPRGVPGRLGRLLPDPQPPSGVADAVRPGARPPRDRAGRRRGALAPGAPLARPVATSTASSRPSTPS